MTANQKRSKLLSVFEASEVEEIEEEAAMRGIVGAGLAADEIGPVAGLEGGIETCVEWT